MDAVRNVFLWTAMVVLIVGGIITWAVASVDYEDSKSKRDNWKIRLSRVATAIGFLMLPVAIFITRATPEQLATATSNVNGVRSNIEAQGFTVENLAGGYPDFKYAVVSLKGDCQYTVYDVRVADGKVELWTANSQRVRFILTPEKLRQYCKL